MATVCIKNSAEHHDELQKRSKQFSSLIPYIKKHQKKSLRTSIRRTGFHPNPTIGFIGFFPYSAYSPVLPISDMWVEKAIYTLPQSLSQHLS
jgi:hypothetical protein